VNFSYPKLYLRMALSIGVALVAFVLIGAAAFAAIAASELSGYVETRGGELGPQAAEVLAAGGLSALKTWLAEDAAIPDNVSILVIGPDGRDILGREIPSEYRRLIATSVVGAPDASQPGFRPVRLAPQIIANDGTAYAFLVLPSNINIWGNTATALGLVAAALLVVATVAWFIAGTIGRPVAELQQAARRLANGDIAARVPARLAERSDELGQLAADFNYMAEQLCSLLEGRENLMSELSHELRSPLARLQAALALAAAHDRLEDHERVRVDREIGLMNQVIGEILRYSSLNTPVRMRTSLVRCDRVLRQLLELEEVEAMSKHCSLNLSTAPDLLVAGDQALLQRAFENVLRNAIRHTAEDSVIDIEGWRDGSTVCVSIRDRGPGVPPELLSQIFEPYVRNTQGSIGSGLGLAIVKRIIERHGGSVSAELCRGPGLRVICRLPAAEFARER
jgi:two-component system sensor histidine kinase CpxA